MKVKVEVVFDVEVELDIKNVNEQNFSITAKNMEVFGYEVKLKEETNAENN